MLNQRQGREFLFIHHSSFINQHFSNLAPGCATTFTNDPTVIGPVASSNAVLSLGKSTVMGQPAWTTIDWSFRARTRPWIVRGGPNRGLMKLPPLGTVYTFRAVTRTTASTGV